MEFRLQPVWRRAAASRRDSIPTLVHGKRHDSPPGPVIQRGPKTTFVSTDCCPPAQDHVSEFLKQRSRKERNFTPTRGSILRVSLQPMHQAAVLLSLGGSLPGIEGDHLPTQLGFTNEM